MVKKLLTFFIVMFVGLSANAQVFTQTFIDRCTGEVKVVTANFTNGPTAVAFYNRVRIFTPQESTNGTLQQWLVETYNWWNALSPCSQAAQQTQQAQQTAQQASQAAQQATSNIPTPPPTSSTNTSSNANTSTSNGTSSNSSSSGGSNSSESKTTSESTESGGSSGGGESSEGSGESSGGESEGESDSGEGDGESSDGEDSEDSEEDSESEEDDKKKKQQQRLNPILVSGDMVGMQSLTGTYNSVLSFGLSQSSIFGDVSYSGNVMVWDNLKQMVFGGSITKMHMNEDYSLEYVESFAINYSRMYKSNSVTLSNSTIKPTKYGTFGFGINGTLMWSSDMKGIIASYGWNVLYTHSLKINERWTYSPAFIMAKNPGSYMSNENMFYTNKDEIGILSNGFDLQISRRFRINLNYTLIASTNPTFPLMHNFMVGSKLQF